MTRGKLFVIGFAVLAATSVGILARGSGQASPGQRGTASSGPRGHVRQHEPVGWVFGRMIGVPGADRPLTSQIRPAHSCPGKVFPSAKMR